jgi:hypothetical protein
MTAKRAVHHWKPLWKGTSITKFICLGCGLKKTATVNFAAGGFPSIVYIRTDGTQFKGKVPECEARVEA